MIENLMIYGTIINAVLFGDRWGIMKRETKYSIMGAVSAIGLTIFAIFSALLFFSAEWYMRNYGDTGFDSVLFTLFSNMNGVSEGLLFSFLIQGALPAVAVTAIPLSLLYLFEIPRVKLWQKNVFTVFLSALFVFLAGTRVNLPGYIHRAMNKTTVYEDYYVVPTEDIISFPEKKRNLVYIFLESMESTYQSKDEGGALSENVIYELTELAKQNTNFSHNSGVGGFLSPEGTGWTVAGLVSQTSGIPLKASSGALENNEYGEKEFLPGVVTLSDILSKNGYNQTVMFGSKASFANRDTYFATHSTESILDLSTAKADGIVPDDYYVWWGMEDYYLFDYAKDKIKELSRKNAPFSFTLLTADTHFPDGYKCSECGDEYEEQYDNVIACSSKQVYSFVKWLKRQSFYKDTVIVICGDHLSMDYQYIKRNVPDDYDRRVYNCIINSAVDTDNSSERTFTSLDLFPTVLASLGCEIDGDRLGLGTNLFSERQTLAEEMGYDEFEHQILFSSDYYIKNFLIDRD